MDGQSYNFTAREHCFGMFKMNSLNVSIVPISLSKRYHRGILSYCPQTHIGKTKIRKIPFSPRVFLFQVFFCQICTEFLYQKLCRIPEQNFKLPTTATNLRTQVSFFFLLHHSLVTSFAQRIVIVTTLFQYDQ